MITGLICGGYALVAGGVFFGSALLRRPGNADEMVGWSLLWPGLLLIGALYYVLIGALYYVSRGLDKSYNAVRNWAEERHKNKLLQKLQAKAEPKLPEPHLIERIDYRTMTCLSCGAPVQKHNDNNGGNKKSKLVETIESTKNQ